jgi:hypothetical protein
VADPSTESTPAEPLTTDAELAPDDYGTLTAEDADAETVDPADVAGTADDDDADPPAT